MKWINTVYLGLLFLKSFETTVRSLPGVSGAWAELLLGHLFMYCRQATASTVVDLTSQ